MPPLEWATRATAQVMRAAHASVTKPGRTLPSMRVVVFDGALHLLPLGQCVCCAGEDAPISRDGLCPSCAAPTVHGWLPPFLSARGPSGITGFVCCSTPIGIAQVRDTVGAALDDHTRACLRSIVHAASHPPQGEPMVAGVRVGDVMATMRQAGSRLSGRLLGDQELRRVIHATVGATGSLIVEAGAIRRATRS